MKYSLARVSGLNLELWAFHSGLRLNVPIPPGTVCREGRRRSKPKKEIGCGLDVFGACCWEVKRVLGMLKLRGREAGQVLQSGRDSADWASTIWESRIWLWYSALPAIPLMATGSCSLLGKGLRESGRVTSPAAHAGFKH